MTQIADDWASHFHWRPSNDKWFPKTVDEDMMIIADPYIKSIAVFLRFTFGEQHQFYMQYDAYLSAAGGPQKNMFCSMTTLASALHFIMHSPGRTNANRHNLITCRFLHADVEQRRPTITNRIYDLSRDLTIHHMFGDYSNFTGIAVVKDAPGFFSIHIQFSI